MYSPQMYIMEPIDNIRFVLKGNFDYLSSRENVSNLTDLLVMMSNNKRKFHVDVDINSIHDLENTWDLSLCRSIGKLMGIDYTPQTQQMFEYRRAGNARYFMIGTREQLQRYKNYAKAAPELEFPILYNIDAFS